LKELREAPDQGIPGGSWHRTPKQRPSGYLSSGPRSRSSRSKTGTSPKTPLSWSVQVYGWWTVVVLQQVLPGVAMMKSSAQSLVELVTRSAVSAARPHPYVLHITASRCQPRCRSAALMRRGV
jgi:hypothetical protein